MPIITPDLSNVNKAIDPGTYGSKIIECGSKISGAGNPMIVPKLEVYVNGKTYIRTAHLVTSGAGAFGFDSLLRACGYGDVADRLKSAPEPFDTDKLLGQEPNVVIDSDMYNGAVTDKISSFLPK